MSANSRVCYSTCFLSHRVSVGDFGGRILIKTPIYVFRCAVCVEVSFAARGVSYLNQYYGQDSAASM